LAFVDYWYQMSVGMVFVAGYLIIILVLKPYISKGDDRLHIFAQTEILLLIMAGLIYQYASGPDAVMDVVMSIVLIGAVCFLLFYFLLQAWQAMYKIYKVQKRKRDKRRQANEGKKEKEEISKSGKEVSQTSQERQMEEHDNKDIFSIRRSDLYEGVRGNRNLFDKDDLGATIMRNPLWMKEKTSGGGTIRIRVLAKSRERKSGTR